jgi:hypothetical protein
MMTNHIPALQFTPEMKESIMHSKAEQNKLMIAKADKHFRVSGVVMSQ